MRTQRGALRPDRRTVGTAQAHRGRAPLEVSVEAQQSQGSLDLLGPPVGTSRSTLASTARAAAAEVIRSPGLRLAWRGGGGEDDVLGGWVASKSEVFLDRTGQRGCPRGPQVLSAGRI